MTEKGYMNTHESKSFQRIYKEFIDTILYKYCGPDKDVCSLGCYNDDLVDQIEFEKLILVDEKFGPCKYYNEQTNSLFYLEQNILDFFAFNEAKYDVVIMSTVIEHLKQSVKHIVLYNIKKHLNPGGIFIMTYPNAKSPNRLLGKEMGLIDYLGLSKRDKEVGHVRMYDYSDLNYFENLLKLELIQEIGIMFKPLPHAMMSEYFPNDLDKFIELGYKLGIKACSYIGGVYQNTKEKKEAKIDTVELDHIAISF